MAIARSVRMAATVGLVVALGVGASTAVLSVWQNLFFVAEPYLEPDALVVLENQGPYDLGSRQVERAELSWPDFEDLESRQRVFKAVGGLTSADPTVWEIGGRTRWVGRILVTNHLMAVLGVRPRLGRVLAEGDFQSGATPVALVTERLWARQLASDPGIVGRTVRVDGAAITVVGVLSDDVVDLLRPRHQLFEESDTAGSLLVPASANSGGRVAATLGSRRQNRGLPALTVVGRLPETAALPGAQREVTSISLRLASEHPDTNARRETHAVPLSQWRTREVSQMQPMLLAVAVLAVLVGCASAVGLVVADLIRREPEMAVRHALGASRARLGRLILQRAFWWTLPGALFAVVCAKAALWWIDLSQGGDVAFRAPMGYRLLIPAAGLGGLSALALAGVGVWVLRNQRLAIGLREAGQSISFGRRRRIVLGALVTVQMAAATSIGLVSGLLLRSMLNIVAVDLGFEAGESFVVRVLLPVEKYGTAEAQSAFFDAALARVRALPDVASAGLSDAPPLSRMTVTLGGGLALEVPGQTVQSLGPVVAQQVSAGYFESAGMKMHRGRAFSDEDDRGGAPVAVVDQAFCRAHLASTDPLQAGIRLGGVRLHVIGVVKDVHHSGPTQGTWATLYVLRRDTQANAPLAHFVVRPAGRARDVTSHVVDEIARMDGRVILDDPETLRNLFARTIYARERTMRLLVLSALVVLLLTAFSVSGALSEFVANRTREIALRKALGASGRDTAAFVFRQVAVPCLGGLILGCVTGWGLGRMLGNELFGLHAADSITVVGTVLLQLSLGVLAAAGPLRRAGAVDPAQALRADL